VPSTDNSLSIKDEPYLRQMTSFRRTRSAILEGTKNLIAAGGLHKATMIDIADTAQVSRATLYNHFRDKDAVLRALIESEVERLFHGALGLEEIAWEISSDPALAKLRSTDPGALARLLTDPNDELWARVRAGLERSVASPTHVDMAVRWLLGQFLQPLSKNDIAVHASLLTR
jgi:AcrR family transcriptional regulator